eukprot:1208935-Rhodomonas_salina.4
MSSDVVQHTRVSSDVVRHTRVPSDVVRHTRVSSSTRQVRARHRLQMNTAGNASTVRSNTRANAPTESSNTRVNASRQREVCRCNEARKQGWCVRMLRSKDDVCQRSKPQQQQRQQRQQQRHQQRQEEPKRPQIRARPNCDRAQPDSKRTQRPKCNRANDNTCWASRKCRQSARSQGGSSVSGSKSRASHSPRTPARPLSVPDSA